MILLTLRWFPVFEGDNNTSFPPWTSHMAFHTGSLIGQKYLLPWEQKRRCL